MQKTKRQVKEAVMRAVEEQVDTLMEWLDSTPTPDLNQIEEQVCRLRGLLCFRQVAQVLRDVGGIHVSSSSVWREVQRQGQRLRAVAEDTTCDVAREGKSAAPRMGCSMDGGMMYVLGEGWKELKIGDVFDVELRQETDAHTGEPVDVGHAVHDTCVAHLGGPDAFGQLLWHTAKQRGWAKASHTVVVADGAAWIWNQVATHFYDSQQLIDWYHACQHLRAAAEALHGVETDAARVDREMAAPIVPGSG